MGNQILRQALLGLQSQLGGIQCFNTLVCIGKPRRKSEDQNTQIRCSYGYHYATLLNRIQNFYIQHKETPQSFSINWEFCRIIQPKLLRKVQIAKRASTRPTTNRTLELLGFMRKPMEVSSPLGHMTLYSSGGGHRLLFFPEICLANENKSW